MGRRLRTITRTIRRRSGEAKAEVLNLTGQTGELTRAATAGEPEPARGAPSHPAAA